MFKQYKNPFVKASTKRKHLKIYLYGDSGVGKTYFALTFPEVAVIDLEGGTDFYSDRFQFHVLDTKSFADVLDAVNFLEQGKHGFKTLVIDPVTIIWSALQEGRLEFKTKNPDKAVSGEEKSFFTYQDWGQLKRFYSLLMTKLVNLPMHIILTSRLKDEYEINGSEMTKIGVKPEAEKSTPYVTDIRFRLEVDKGGSRVAIFEKDRTGHFDRGTRIQNPSFETFKSLMEENVQSDQKPQAMHQSENDAAQKDAEFFRQQQGPDADGREQSEEEDFSQTGGNGSKDVGGNGQTGSNQQSSSNRQGGGNGNGRGGNGNNGSSGHNDQKAIPLGLLLARLTSLGFKGLVEQYKAYCYRKYKISSMNELSDSQREEQKKILESCLSNPQRKADFEAMLREIKLHEGQSEDQSKAAKQKGQSNEGKPADTARNNPYGKSGNSKNKQPSTAQNGQSQGLEMGNQSDDLPSAPSMAAGQEEAGVKQPVGAGFDLF